MTGAALVNNQDDNLDINARIQMAYAGDDGTGLLRPNLRLNDS